MDHLARQPVVMCFSVGTNIQKWIGNWSIYNPGDEQNRTGHCMVAVGYGRDLETSEDYWICLNSMGIEWGINGYGRLLRCVYRNPIQNAIIPFVY
ncbi:Cysteine peptidase, histidine active site [Trema orientale]|uniref:Cysteine peptidase, histidine active site n=1 Tax=Trema orientale TaxID=63057 RepID=A0A2P5E637_TREOI|nr:Cysteine peptidase, histidine active site [Trema orientale]